MYTQEELQRELDLRFHGRIQVRFSAKDQCYALYEKSNGRDRLLYPLVDLQGRPLPLSDFVVRMVHKHAARYNVPNKNAFVRQFMDPLKEREERQEKELDDKLSEISSQEVKPVLDWMTKAKTSFAASGEHDTGHNQRNVMWGKMGREARGLKK